MMEMFLIIVFIIAAPLLLFFGIVGLAIFIWCWNRIGRYFVNLARWLGNWRNFVPLTILGITILLVLVVLWRFLLPQLGILWIIFLVLHLLVTFFCLTFAAIYLVYAFHEWFWPKYKRWLWRTFAYLFGQRQAGRRRARPQARPRPEPGTESAGDARTATQQRPPQKRSAAGSFWDLMLGRPPQRAKAAAPAQPGAPNVQPPRETTPAKRSWFGTFWASMLRKPEPKRQQARPSKVQTTEQTLSPSGTMPASAGAESRIPDTSPTRRASGRKPAKRSWFISFWALMTGKPSKTATRTAQPDETKARDRAERSPRPEAAEAKTGAATRLTKATSGEKPARRGFFSGMWNSIVRGVTFVVGLIILAVLWVVQKIRDGIDWIRVRLNLD